MSQNYQSLINCTLRLNFPCNNRKLHIERAAANYSVIPVVIKIRYIMRIYVIMIYIVDFIFCTIRQIGHVSRSLRNIHLRPTLMYYSALSVTCVYFRVLYVLSYPSRMRACVRACHEMVTIITMAAYLIPLLFHFIYNCFF